MIITEFECTQKFIYEVGELRAVSGHVLGAAGSQEKDTVIRKLKERIKSLRGNVNEDKVKKDKDEIETIGGFGWVLGELRAVSGHVLGAAGVQIPENNLDNLNSIVEEDRTLEIVDPRDLLGLDVLFSRGIGFLRGTLAVVVILVKGHTFPTIIKVLPVGCDPLALVGKFTLVEDSIGCDPLALVGKFTLVEDRIGLLETMFDEDVVLMGVFPDEVIGSVNLIFLVLFTGVKAISLSPKLLMQGQEVNRHEVLGYIGNLLPKSKPVSITTVRPVSVDVPKVIKSRPNYAHTIVTKSKSTIRRHKTRSHFSKTSNSSLRVTAAKAQVVNAAKGKKGKWDKGVTNNGCSRHMTGNMSYLSDFQELNGRYVAFGGNPKGGKISSKGKIKTDSECLVLSPYFKLPNENQVLLRVLRENNMYNVNLKDIVPSGDLTCLFAKAIIDESNLWHRRLGHVNFKTINRLVKGNLVRGLPTKVFENQNTCVACKKGKQHRASCKTKPISSVTQPLFRLHTDLFGPTFVKSLNKKCYCLVITDDYSKFTWVFFLATKDEISSILKTFFTGLENQLSLKVKQNGIAERKNRTLIEAARTMLADSLLHVPFWAEVDEGFLVGYSVNRKAFRVFNSRTRIVQETLHVNFLKNKPNVAGTGPTWLFDIDSLTRTMNYQQVIAGNQSNPSSGFQEEFDAGKTGEEANQQYMLFPVWYTGLTNPQNKEGDATFDGKEHDAEKPESTVNLSPSSSALCKIHVKYRSFHRIELKPVED
nr:hypothetical protein [Tanacetum cinerariifolium]